MLWVIYLLQKKNKKKSLEFVRLLVRSRPGSGSLFLEADPLIRIHIKMKWILNAGKYLLSEKRQSYKNCQKEKFKFTIFEELSFFRPSFNISGICHYWCLIMQNGRAGEPADFFSSSDSSFFSSGSGSASTPQAAPATAPKGQKHAAPCGYGSYYLLSLVKYFSPIKLLMWNCKKYITVKIIVFLTIKTYYFMRPRLWLLFFLGVAPAPCFFSQPSPAPKEPKTSGSDQLQLPSLAKWGIF